MSWLAVVDDEVIPADCTYRLSERVFLLHHESWCESSSLPHFNSPQGYTTDAMQINQIVKEDGLALSLIRPRKDHSKSIQHNLPTPPTTAPNDATPDVEMDGLVEGIANIESSLTFLPRGVRKKQVAKEQNMDS